MTTLTGEAAPPPARPATPVAPGERILLLDVLRGFAIFGILVVNVLFYSMPLEWVVAPSWTAIHDRLSSAVITIFFTGKFYTIFSFLFGLGFAIQLARAYHRGTPIVGRYIRRLVVLFAIGVAHAALIWYGDILHTYAFLGLFLILFRWVRPSRLVLAAVICALIPVGLYFLSAAATSAMPASQDPAAMLGTERALEVYAHGSWVEIARQRVHEWLLLDALSFFFLPTIFAMFLLGLLAGKTRAWALVRERRAAAWKLFVVALPLGLTLNVLVWLLRTSSDPMVPSWTQAWAQAAYAVGVPLLALAYVTGLALLLESRWRDALLPLAPVGRMALTNYLLQSVVCTLIFYSYGLGWFGRVGPWIAIPLAIAIFAVQVVLSAWWFRRFRFGPVEWVWRTLTYGRV
ncbi:MAG: DUF418 domain-containing protein [Thermoanaerobaculia bacterium]